MTKEENSNITELTISIFFPLCELLFKSTRLQIVYAVAYRLKYMTTVTLICYLQNLVGTGFDTGNHVSWA